MARLYSASPRADGGIGRRARLRAWSGITGWRFESSSAHLRKPRSAGLSSFSGRSLARGGRTFRGNASGNWGTPCAPACSPRAEAPMSVHYDREPRPLASCAGARTAGSGRRRFADEDEARGVRRASRRAGRRASTARAVRPPSGRRRWRLRSTRRRDGSRWRFVFRQSDGTLTTRRGFTSRRAAAAARRTARRVDRARRGQARARDVRRVLGALLDEQAAVPDRRHAAGLRDPRPQAAAAAFGELPLAGIDEDRVRGWLAEMAELVDGGELAPRRSTTRERACRCARTRRSARAHPANPCRYVPALPVERHEIDYLRARTRSSPTSTPAPSTTDRSPSS